MNCSSLTALEGLNFSALTSIKQEAFNNMGSFSLELGEFFDMFDITDETDSSTLNGWVMEHLGRIPDIGDKFSAHGLEITIKAADGRRVNEINVVHTPAQPEKDTK